MQTMGTNRIKAFTTGRHRHHPHRDGSGIEGSNSATLSALKAVVPTL